MKRLFELLLLALLPIMAVSCGSDVQTVKVISLNLRYSTPQDGDNCWENRKPAVINMVNAEKPDVMGTQECLASMDEYLSANLKGYARLGVGRDDGDRGGEMMAIYYNTERLELLSSGNFWLSATPDTVSRGWDGACNRMVTWGCFRIKGTDKSFYHYNTHLDHIGPVAREEGIKLIAQRAGEKYAEDSIPFFVTGDMNSGVDQPIYEPLKAIAVDARAAAPVTDSKSTYQGYGKAGGVNVIDHVFESGLQPVSFRTLDGDYGVPYISDHYPVEAVLSFSE